MAKKEKDNRTQNHRPLKYGEPTIKYNHFYVPESKKEHINKIIKDTLKGYQDAYEQSKKKRVTVMWITCG